MITRATTFALCLLVCAGSPTAAQENIDQRSYNLGIIGGFAEIVRLGVKKLALSEVMTPDDMDAMLDDAKIVARRNKVRLYREPELIVTDLYPADVAEGKDVLLIYTGNTLQEYLDLKADKDLLIASDSYRGKARREIAVRFGQLLSYPQAVIDELIAQQTGGDAQ
ncbi:hypothetical protein [Woeseia oceani]|uniref:hypothetical protein n=1 Tax=Woeseia oceani TaxID=1548547 RepID=UPI0012EA28E1|nr:hypothetical protein [Woeseia oceani]